MEHQDFLDLRRGSFADFFRVPRALNARGNANRTLLHTAISSRKCDIARELVRLGVDLNCQDTAGKTALYYAIEFRMFDLAEELVNKGADPNLVDRFGNNAVWAAVMQGADAAPLIRRLVEAGGVFDQKNSAGRSSFDIAEDLELQEIIEIFGAYR